MTAYGSYCPKGEPAVLNSTVVAISNSLFSFISGFAVFASLGHLAHISGVKVTELDYSGFSLGTFVITYLWCIDSRRTKLNDELNLPLLSFLQMLPL